MAAGAILSYCAWGPTPTRRLNADASLRLKTGAVARHGRGRDSFLLAQHSRRREWRCGVGDRRPENREDDGRFDVEVELRDCRDRAIEAPLVARLDRHDERES